VKLSATALVGIVMGLAAGLLLVAPHEARADFFKYKDDSGATVITNKLEDVPSKYRRRIKVIWDKELEAKDPLARRWAAAKEQQERQDAAQLPPPGAQKKQPGSKKGQTLVIEMDETTGEVKRRFE